MRCSGRVSPEHLGQAEQEMTRLAAGIGVIAKLAQASVGPVGGGLPAVPPMPVGGGLPAVPPMPNGN
eukprot:12995969-Heterocapsa_arctica.AAC.1